MTTKRLTKTPKKPKTKNQKRFLERLTTKRLTKKPKKTPQKSQKRFLERLITKKGRQEIKYRMKIGNKQDKLVFKKN